MNLKMTKTLLIINLLVLLMLAIGTQQNIESANDKTVAELKETIETMQYEIDNLQNKVAMYEDKLIELNAKANIKEEVKPSQDEKILSLEDIDRTLVGFGNVNKLFQPGEEAKKELEVKHEGIILDRPGALRYEQYPFIPKTYVADTEILSTSKTYDVDKVRKVLEKLAPEIVGIEDALLIQYENTGIKPEIIFGIIGIESGLATSRLAKEKNNMVGWNAYPSANRTVYQNASTFYSKSDCVMILGQSLYKNYITKGYGTLEKISVKYCGGNSIWYNSIRSFAKKFVDTYNSL